MKQRDTVEFEMKKALQSEALLDTRVFQCEILKYDSKSECIYLLLKSGNLSEISLDAVYECRIDSQEEIIVCDGRVKQRYRNEEGNILDFRVENGFYKNSIKPVDKQES